MDGQGTPKSVDSTVPGVELAEERPKWVHLGRPAPIPYFLFQCAHCEKQVNLGQTPKGENWPHDWCRWQSYDANNNTYAVAWFCSSECCATRLGAKCQSSDSNG